MKETKKGGKGNVHSSPGSAELVVGETLGRVEVEDPEEVAALEADDLVAFVFQADVLYTQSGKQTKRVSCRGLGG